MPEIIKKNFTKLSKKNLQIIQEKFSKLSLMKCSEEKSPNIEFDLN